MAKKPWVWSMNDVTSRKPVTSVAYEPLPPCHKGNILIGTTEDFALYGGGYSNGAEYWNDQVIIDLADIMIVDEVKVFGLKLTTFMNSLKKDETRIIKIHVKDYKVPGLSLKQWCKLLN